MQASLIVLGVLVLLVIYIIAKGLSHRPTI